MSDVFHDFSKIETDGFGPKFLERHGEAATKVDAFHAALNEDATVKAHFDGLNEKVTTARANLEGLAQDASAEVRGAHQATLTEAQGDVKKFLTGEDAGGVKAPESVTKAYGEAEKATGGIMKTINSKIHGRWSVTGTGETLKHNFGQMKNAITGGGAGRTGVGFGRIAATGAGAALTVHAIAKSQTADGEKRSILGRVVEGGVGVGLMYGGALAGSFAR